LGWVVGENNIIQLLGSRLKLSEVLEELIGFDLNCPLANLQALPDLETAYTHVMQTLVKKELLFAPGASVDELKALVNTYRVTVQAHVNYQIPGRVQCPIHLFRAETKTAGPDGVEFEDTREFWGWADWTQAGVIEYWVLGTHVTMMTPPQVQTLANAISTYL
jgi:thioesterase domain-containing protein